MAHSQTYDEKDRKKTKYQHEKSVCTHTQAYSIMSYTKRNNSKTKLRTSMLSFILCATVPYMFGSAQECVIGADRAHGGMRESVCVCVCVCEMQSANTLKSGISSVASFAKSSLIQETTCTNSLTSTSERQTLSGPAIRIWAVVNGETDQRISHEEGGRGMAHGWMHTGPCWSGGTKSTPAMR